MGKKEQGRREGSSKWKGPLCDDGNVPDCMGMENEPIQSLEQFMDMQCFCEDGRDYYDILMDWMEENKGKIQRAMNQGGQGGSATGGMGKDGKMDPNGQGRGDMKDMDGKDRERLWEVKKDQMEENKDQ